MEESRDGTTVDRCDSPPLPTRGAQPDARHPVLLLEGPRSVGKSTLLRQVADSSGGRLVSLDDRARRSAALANASLLLGGEETVCIDEYQKAPHILNVIKAELTVQPAQADTFQWGPRATTRCRQQLRHSRVGSPACPYTHCPRESFPVSMKTSSFGRYVIQPLW